jgi:hypothetical protein
VQVLRAQQRRVSLPVACRANQTTRPAPRTPKTPQQTLRLQANFTSRFNVIWVVQPPPRGGALGGRYFRTVSSRQEGRIAIVTNAGRDVVDAAASGASVMAGRLVRERSNGAQDERR